MTDDLKTLCNRINEIGAAFDTSGNAENAETCYRAARVIEHLYGKASEFYTIAENLSASLRQARGE